MQYQQVMFGLTVIVLILLFVFLQKKPHYLKAAFIITIFTYILAALFPYLLLLLSLQEIIIVYDVLIILAVIGIYKLIYANAEDSDGKNDFESPVSVIEAEDQNIIIINDIGNEKFASHSVEGVLEDKPGVDFEERPVESLPLADFANKRNPEVADTKESDLAGADFEGNLTAELLSSTERNEAELSDLVMPGQEAAGAQELDAVAGLHISGEEDLLNVAISLLPENGVGSVEREKLDLELETADPVAVFESVREEAIETIPIAGPDFVGDEIEPEELAADSLDNNIENTDEYVEIYQIIDEAVAEVLSELDGSEEIKPEAAVLDNSIKGLAEDTGEYMESPIEVLPAESGDDIQYLINEAFDAKFKDDFNGAIRVFEEILKLNPPGELAYLVFEELETLYRKQV